MRPTQEELEERNILKSEYIVVLNLKALVQLIRKELLIIHNFYFSM